MKEMIEYVAQALVDNPDEVDVREIVGRQVTVLELKVAKEDVGKVIGKGGQNAKALRTLLTAASGKQNKRFMLEILE
jgi:uncharacterized protein